MERRAIILRESVMNSIADDYENFDRIIGWATEYISAQGLQSSREELLAILKQLIADGYAQAYLLSPKPPYSTPVPFSTRDVDNLWFCLTPSGLSAIKKTDNSGMAARRLVLLHGGQQPGAGVQLQQPARSE